MPSVTFDGRSLLLDGRRLWIVGGSIHYARLPRETWAERIRAARHAGLNTIETPVVWARHEPRPGQFDFAGENDLRSFVKMVGEAGMHCILRPGPYVGSGFDLGGLPPWLTSLPGLRLRTQNGPFLEACSRYITALAKQVADLQVTSSGRGGPLLMIQNEHAWTCGHDDLAHAYLGELLRYYREAGFSVPVVNANNLWQSVEGEIECWSGSEDMFAAVRQLGVVRPRNPRIVIDLRIGQAASWGVPAPDLPSTAALVRAAAQVLAAGGQFVLNPFAGGTNFGFSGGRLHTAHDAFVTASHHPDAPLSEGGELTDSGRALRRLCTFASRFARVFANLDPDPRSVLLDPAAIPGQGLGMSLAHVQGAQGGVAFVFDEPPSRSRTPRYAHLVLPDGLPVAAPLSSQGVAWCLLGTRVGGRSEIDYCALNALTSFGRALVCFGPEGSRGVVSVNGSPLEVEVPRGKSAEPLVVEHEGVVLIVLSEEQADRTLVLDDAIIHGACGTDAAGQPLPAPGARHMTRIDGEGRTERIKIGPAPGGTRNSAPSFGAWEAAPADDFAAGTSQRYAVIAGPDDLTRLGAPHGYGWYRLTFRSSKAKRVKVAFPHASDRLHLFLDGESQGIIGVGPGADLDPVLQLRKSEHVLVALADNLGRLTGGSHLGEPKGLYGHVWETTNFRSGRMKLSEESPVELMAFRTPLWETRKGDVTHPMRATWTFAHRRKTPIIVTVGAFVGRGLVMLNGKPIHYLDRPGPDRIVLTSDMLSRGNNTLQIALAADSIGHEGAEAMLNALAPSVQIVEGSRCISEKAEWAFAAWEPPPSHAFSDQHKAGGRRGPVWWRASFKAADDRPLMLELTGMTKGQIFLNGRNVSRYWVATATGKGVPPQTRYLLPGPWLKPGAENVLLLFDEHGGNPSRTSLHHAG